MARSKGRLVAAPAAFGPGLEQPVAAGDVFPLWHELSRVERLFLRMRFHTTTDTEVLLAIGKMKDVSRRGDSSEAGRKKKRYEEIKGHSWVTGRRHNNPAFKEAHDAARRSDFLVRRQIERSYLLDQSSQLLDATLDLARGAASEQTRLRALELALKFTGYVTGGTGAGVPKSEKRGEENGAEPVFHLVSPANEETQPAPLGEAATS